MHRCKSGDPGTPWRTGLTSTPWRSLTYWRVCGTAFIFPVASPVLLLPLPIPSHLLSAPSLLRLCSFSLPRRSGLHVTHVAKAAAASYRVTWMCRSQELSRKRALQAACNQPSLACPRHPTAIPRSQLLGEELNCPSMGQWKDMAACGNANY